MIDRRIKEKRVLAASELFQACVANADAIAEVLFHSVTSSSTHWSDRKKVMLEIAVQMYGSITADASVIMDMADLVELPEVIDESTIDREDCSGESCGTRETLHAT